MNLHELTNRELATILAALRHWQGILAGSKPAVEDLNDIASDGGRFEPLTPEEIDNLCERLNGAGRRTA